MRSTLQTPRLTLHPIGLQHLSAIVRWEADAVLRDQSDDDASPAPAHEVEAAVRGWMRAGRDDILPLAIHLRDDDRCIGWCMLAAIDRASRECRVGLTIGERDLWGRRLGREVLSALVEHAFGPLAMRRVIGEVHAFNDRSRRLLEGLGFRVVSVEAGTILRGDRAFDELLYAIDRDHSGWVQVIGRDGASHCVPLQRTTTTSDPATKAIASESFLHGHDRVVDAVTSGRVDMGATFCTVDPGTHRIIQGGWTNPDGTNARPVDVIALVGPIPNDAILVSTKLPAEVCAKVLEWLLDPPSRVRELLATLVRADGFRVASPAHFDPLRRTLRAARARGEGPASVRG